MLPTPEKRELRLTQTWNMVIMFKGITKQTTTCLKPGIEIPEKRVKYVQS